MNVSKSEDNFKKDFELKDILSLYLRHWKWFAIGVILAVIGAKLYLRYTTPMFEAVSSIRLTSLKNNPSPEEALLGELGLVYGGDKLHTDEIQILRSRSLVGEVIKELNFNVQVFSEGNIKDVELYNSNPIRITHYGLDTIDRHSSYYFEISIRSNSEYIFIDEYDIESVKSFGSEISTPVGKIVITPSESFDLEKYKGKQLKVVLRSVEALVSEYRDKLYAFSLNDQVDRSNMIKVGVTDPVPEKAELFINTLVKNYNERSIDDKKKVAKETFDFINERITMISSDLSRVESAKERFKVGNTLTDVSSEAGMYVQAEAANETELLRVGTELNMVNYMLRSLRDQDEDTFKVIPTNIGLNDSSIMEITSQYNQFILERDRLLRNSGVNNPVIQQLNDRLRGLRSSLVQSLENLKNTLLIRQSNLNRQSELLGSKIASVPGQERRNRDIERQQNIKESILMYLLQKREEAGMTMATANPSAEVIDRAEVDEFKPVSPKGKLVYLASGVLGLFIPFTLIFVKNLLNSKIRSRRDLEPIQHQVKVIGELPKLVRASKINDDGSVFAEALRVIRTNLNFIRHKQPGEGQMIFVTSSVHGEGKSFLSYHLARVYAYTNSKVLLIGADIRKPNLHAHIPISNKSGLSDYLSGSVELDEVITKAPDIANLSILHSGRIPPNPAELLLSDSVGDLFEHLKDKFDYIIVDTAPTMMVTDTLLISKYADQTLYIVRADYSEKEVLSFIKELSDEDKLPKMSLLLNDVKVENFRYKGKYGYGYTMERNLPWHKRILKKLSFS